MKAVLIRLEECLHKQLRQKSVDTGKTVTKIVLEAINDSLDSSTNKKDGGNK